MVVMNIFKSRTCVATKRKSLFKFDSLWKIAKDYEYCIKNYDHETKKNLNSNKTIIVNLFRNRGLRAVIT